MDRRTSALGIVVAIAAVAVLVVAVEGVPPGSGVAPAAARQSDAVWLALYDGEMVNETLRDLGPYLRPGDGIAIVMANNSSEWASDNEYAAELHAAYPFVTLRAYLSLDGGTGRAGGLAATIAELSPLFTEASAQWEVHGPVEFNASYNATAAYFAAFARLVRDSGRLAIGYPSGRGVLGDYSVPPYDWNYGAFARELDGMTIETQGLCVNASEWPVGVDRVWGEYNASGVSIETLSLQVSLGAGGNGVNATEAATCAGYWRGVAHGNVFLWWGPSMETPLISVLRAIGR